VRFCSPIEANITQQANEELATRQWSFLGRRETKEGLAAPLPVHLGHWDTKFGLLAVTSLAGR
jgi:hypothetical protein